MTELTPAPDACGGGSRPADAGGRAVGRHRSGNTGALAAPSPPRLAGSLRAGQGERRGVGPSCPPCTAGRPPPSSTPGISVPAAGPTPSTRPPCRPVRRAGRPCSSGPRTRPTSSPSTSRRRFCGRWTSRRASSASTRGACWCPRPSRAWPQSDWSTSRCGGGSAPRPPCSAAPWWHSRRWPPSCSATTTRTRCWRCSSPPRPMPPCAASSGHRPNGWFSPGR